MARAVLAEIIDDEMLVPELNVHVSSSLLDNALILVPYVRMSGLIMPFPSSKTQVDIPLLLNEATLFPF